jgi:hypothetical protein
MLDKGRYIPESKPVIGRAYIPSRYNANFTREESFAQDLLLSEEKSSQTSQSFFSWFFGKLMRL